MAQSWMQSQFEAGQGARDSRPTDYRLLRRLLADKLRDRSTYILAAIVGTLINVYGQLLVPWFRGSFDPVVAFLIEFDIRPGLTIFSVFIAYAFPFCVGIYSAVAARYRNRRVESVADFPDRKPDPVFRASMSGRLVEVGARTQEFFAKHQIDSAQKILGEEVWSRIVNSDDLEPGTRIYFAGERIEFMVTHARTANNEVNIYLTRLPGRT